MTQHQRILQLHENREWICQAEYRNISWCHHKRRKDIEEGRARGIMAGTYHFESKDCEHGIKGSRDYLLVRRVDQDVKEEKSEERKALDNIFNQWIDNKRLEIHRPFDPEKVEQTEKLNL